jgi:general secretion pathway protein G
MKRSAFTLIEVLIVVVIMATLAATIIPQFASSTEDAKGSAVKHNLRTLREIIQIYSVHHRGTWPSIVSGGLPGLTLASDASGATNATSSATYPLGPYIQGGKLPINPFDGKNTVTLTNTFPPSAATAAGGWLYDPTTGRIAPNTAGHLTD